jgi:primosomal protein N' (replication factor Y)
MASERTFSLLTQAAGRAGRGTKAGDVIIQTYQPDNYAVRYAADQDYGGFYREEIQYRRLLLYPPVWHMLAVEVSSKDEDTALLFAGRCKELLDRICAGLNRNQTPPRVLIIGPAPASYARLRDAYRFAVYVKCQKYGTLVTCKDRIELLCAAVNPDGKLPLSLQFDFDPVNAW